MRKSLLLIATFLLAQTFRAGMFMSLSEAINLAQEHSLEVKMARFSFLGSYWTYRFYRAELLPSALLSGSLQNYDRCDAIMRRDEYELLYWDAGWRTCGTAKAEYEYVRFDDVPRGRLYWLVNMSRGKEEMPFVLDEHGRQRFVYYDIINRSTN